MRELSTVIIVCLRMMRHQGRPVIYVSEYEAAILVALTVGRELGLAIT